MAASIVFLMAAAFGSLLMELSNVALIRKGDPLTVTGTLRASRVKPFDANSRTSYAPPSAGAVNCNVALEMPFDGGVREPFRYDQSTKVSSDAVVRNSPTQSV